jgi:catechol 2,3-dioxygenase-like lactoylglutathione lyase family enzyme
MPTRFGHANVIARDWRVLAAFYRTCFGCVDVPPERHYGGADLSAGTGVPDAALDGVHLRLPGYGADGPTLEIYQYSANQAAPLPVANRVGWGHIAFAVDDVATAQQTVLANGGTPVGEIVTLQTSDGRRVTWCYVRDPEGNLVELQAWSDA